MIVYRNPILSFFYCFLKSINISQNSTIFFILFTITLQQIKMKITCSRDDEDICSCKMMMMMMKCVVTNVNKMMKWSDKVKMMI